MESLGVGGSHFAKESLVAEEDGIISIPICNFVRLNTSVHVRRPPEHQDQINLTPWRLGCCHKTSMNARV